jgi:phenylacetate-CoA ligase
MSVRRQGRLTGSRLASLQSAKLRSIVSRAYSTVPFYREQLDRYGIKPAEFRGLEDLKDLPIITRTDIQDTPLEDLIPGSMRLENCVRRNTGGSTGKPITVCATPESIEYEAMVWLRSWAKLGLKATDRQVTVKELADYPDGNKVKWFQRLGFYRIQYLDIFDPAEDLCRRISGSRPDILRGPASILHAIAQQPDASGIRPRMLFSTSELLSRARRRSIESIFQAPVHDIYGATEAGCIAWRSPESGIYIVNSDSVIVEILTEGRATRPGELGDVVITNLFADAMPFIRYSLGDTCEVGERVSTSDSAEVASIRRILGRSLNPKVLPDGTRVSPYWFMPDEIPGIREFRVIHESAELVKIFVVMEEGSSRDAMEAERLSQQDYVGSQCRIAVEYVNSIPTDL